MASLNKTTLSPLHPYLNVSRNLDGRENPKGAVFGPRNFEEFRLALHSSFDGPLALPVSFGHLLLSLAAGRAGRITGGFASKMLLGQGLAGLMGLIGDEAAASLWTAGQRIRNTGEDYKTAWVKDFVIGLGTRSLLSGLFPLLGITTGALLLPVLMAGAGWVSEMIVEQRNDFNLGLEASLWTFFYRSVMSGTSIAQGHLLRVTPKFFGHDFSLHADDWRFPLNNQATDLSPSRRPARLAAATGLFGFLEPVFTIGGGWWCIGTNDTCI